MFQTTPIIIETFYYLLELGSENHREYRGYREKQWPYVVNLLCHDPFIRNNLKVTNLTPLDNFLFPIEIATKSRECH